MFSINFPDVVQLQEQQTALHIASRLGNVDIVGILLQHGAAVDAVTKDSYTALHIAAKEGQEEVASLLLDQGANLTATTKVSAGDSSAVFLTKCPNAVNRRVSRRFTWLPSMATSKLPGCCWQERRRSMLKER